MKSDRRNTMKSSTKDQAKGKFHKVTGKIKEISGKLSKNPKLIAGSFMILLLSVPC
jgi:hypothetical protein